MNKRVYTPLCQVTLVVSDSLPPYGPQPARLLSWGSPSKNTGVVCHAFLQGIFLTQGLHPCLMFLALAGGFFATRANWEIPYTPFYTHTNGCRKKHRACHVVCQSVMSDSATSWAVARQAPLSMEFSRQDYQNEQPFPSLGDLPNPGIEPRSPALQGDSLPFELPGKPIQHATLM